ncbi:AHH domain-containing protein, partial [Roseburia intestinalis]
MAGGNPTLYGYVYDTLCELDPFGLGRMPSWMTTRKGWQRHHLIPVSVWDKYFIPQEAGMNVNGATNMTYLPVAQGIDLVNPNSSLHVGWNNVHSEYNQYISQE